MPVHSVKGQPNCYQWGKTGKIYCGAGAKDNAERQGRAIHASGWKEAETFEAAQRFDYGKIIYDTFYGDGNKPFREYQERLCINGTRWFNVQKYKHLILANYANYAPFEKGIKAYIKRNARKKQVSREDGGSTGEDFIRFMIKDKLFLFKPDRESVAVTSIDAIKPHIIKDMEKLNYSKSQTKMAINLLNRGKYGVFSEYIWASDVFVMGGIKLCFSPKSFFAYPLESDLENGKKFKSESTGDEDDEEELLTPSQKMKMEQVGINKFRVSERNSYNLHTVSLGKNTSCTCGWQNWLLKRKCRHINYVLSRLKFNALSQSQRKTVLRKTIRGDQETMDAYNFENREDGINFLLLYMKED
jgi:hypothetical protein